MSHKFTFALAAAAFCFSAGLNHIRAEEKVPGILIDGEGWQEVSSGHGFTDGVNCDADGNVLFSDMGKGIIFRVTVADGKVAPFIPNAIKFSGIKYAPDGRLYTCQNGSKKIVAIEPNAEAGKEAKFTTLAENVGCNDLAVSKKGIIYFTETGKSQVTIVMPDGKVLAGANETGRPNGICLSPDQTTLAVSDYAGVALYTFKIADDGSLSDKKVTATLQAPPPAEGKKPVSGGDGMCADTQGRYYVTSNLGIQVFDKDGKALGIIEKPQAKAAVSCAFGGQGLGYLYVCNTDKVFRRKVSAQGFMTNK